MKSKKIISVISAVLAVLMIASALSGCSGASPELKESKEKAAKVISEYNSGLNAVTLDCANEAFAKGDKVAKAFKPTLSDSELEKIAQDNGLTSITVSDAKGNIVACYPKGAESGKLKDTKDKVSFTKIAKGITEKMVNDDPPYNAEAGTYAILAGVKRQDADGAVIIGYDSKEYAKVTGVDLANECGENAVVVKEDKVISSNIDGIELNKTLDDIGISKDDLKKESFTFKVGDKSYNAVAATDKDLTAICASSK